MSQIQRPHLKIHNCLSTWNVSLGLIWEEVPLETWLVSFFLFWRSAHNFSRVTSASLNTTPEISSLTLSWSCLHNMGLEAATQNTKLSAVPVWNEDSLQQDTPSVCVLQLLTMACFPVRQQNKASRAGAVIGARDVHTA